MLTIIALLASLSAFASEVDSFTNRPEDLADVTDVVDGYVNGQLLEAVSRAGNCDAETLRSHVKDALAQLFFGGFERHLFRHPEIPHAHTDFEESIYRDFAFLDAPTLHLTPFGLGSLLRVNGQFMGADKLGHFFTEGSQYYALAFVQGRGVETALAYGWSLEQWLYGRNTTGVQSYADLAANYNGMLFWQNLTQPHPRSGLPPLVTCVDGRYEFTRLFSIAEYVDESFDEAYNCSEYSTPEMQRLVERRLEELSLAQGRRLVCPMDPSACGPMRARYGEYASRIVSPRCR